MTGKVIQGSFVGGQPRWSFSVQPKMASSWLQTKTMAPPPTAFEGRSPSAPPPTFAASRPGRAPVIVTGHPPRPPAPAHAALPTALQDRAAGGAFAGAAGPLGLVSSGGRPLPDAVRGKMEAALGADFSRAGACRAASRTDRSDRLHCGLRPLFLPAAISQTRSRASSCGPRVGACRAAARRPRA